MQEGTIYIKRIMDTYYKVTETGSFYFNNRLNPILSHPEFLSIHEFYCMGFNSLLSFLAETLSGPVSDNKYFAFFLHNNILCHVVFLTSNNKYIGAIVTEPILMKTLTEAEFDALYSHTHVPNVNKAELHKILAKKKIVPYDKAMSLGTTLYSLNYSLFQENPGFQVLKSYSNLVKKTNKSLFSSTRTWNTQGIERHLPSSTYFSIKRAIQEGDTKKIIHIIDQQSAVNVPMYHLHKTDHMRSIKNSIIKFCTMTCYTAIDAGAPYIQTLDMVDDMIQTMELTDSITELYEMLKNMCINITKAVSDSKKSIYSQPVRKILDYLSSHYSEKVTLEDLSNITRLSTYYISNLMKAETGISLNDNINKIRIEQSKKMLLEKNSSILEVAQSVGFHYQNHFASVFKKYSGIAPSEYRNAHGINISVTNSHFETNDNEIIANAIQQIKSKLAIFNGMYDIARIVDPIEHTSRTFYGDDKPELDLVCYDFWNKNEFCENCVSMRAYIQNDTYFKLEQKNEQTFLVLAFPEYIGKTIYITEILKDISNKSIITIHSSGQNNSANNTDNLKDAQTGFYTRYYIDKELPLEIRKSKTEHIPLALIAVVINLPERATDTYGYPAGLAESAMSCLHSPDDWIGHYTGNILLFVLHNHTTEQVKEIASTIRDILKGKLDSLGYTDTVINISEQSLCQKMIEAGELLYLLFSKLFVKVQSDT